MSKMVVAALAFVCVSPIGAATYPTNSVDGLVCLLKTYATSDTVIELAPGDYPMPAVPTYTNTSAGYASIYVNNQRVRGTGASPADVRLIGTGETRVVYGGRLSVMENLTITGGRATQYQTSKTSTRGGGYYGNGMLTNCIVLGNNADTHGGGVQAGPKLYDCIVTENQAPYGGGGHNLTAYHTVFRNNSAGSDGGGVYSATLYGCILTNNTADGTGGAGYDVKYATNTLFAANTAAMGGGVGNGNMLECCIISNNYSGGRAGGVYNHSAWGCTIVGNSGTFGGGAVGCMLTNCVVTCNKAREGYRNQGGGGAYNCELVGCTVSANVAFGHGGGAFDNTGVDVISNCTFFGNMVSNDTINAYGGGLCIDAGTAVNCIFYGNAAMTGYNATQNKSYTSNGGGVGSDDHTGGLMGCLVHDNYATAYGGGACDMALLTDCIVSNNWSDSYGGNVYGCGVSGSEVVGASAAYGWACGTVFRDIGRYVAVSNNPYYDGMAREKYLYRPYPNCTNCLFRDNHMVESGSAMFTGESANKASFSSSLVNCTIVSNDCAYMFRFFTISDHPMRVENSLFYKNGDRTGATRRDMTSYDCNTNALRFACCVYSLSYLKDDNGNGNRYDTSDWFDVGDWHLGEGGLPSDPGFVGAKDPIHPYSLRTSSPLLGLAPVADWMATAFDIRGEGYPRIRDGKVDIGCYQCWLNPKGLTISFF